MALPDDIDERDVAQLREYLRQIFRAMKFSHEDSEDFASDVAYKCYAQPKFLAEDSDGRLAYAREAARRYAIDQWSSPGRRLGLRLNACLNTTGKDPISWESGDLVIVGLSTQKGAKPIALDEVMAIEERLGDFLYQPDGLGGVNPGAKFTRYVVSRLLRWLERPCEKTALVALMVAIVPVPERPIQWPDDWDPSYDLPPISDVEPIRKAIRGLPFRGRAAILLKFFDDDLIDLFENHVRIQLAAYLDRWVSPPSLLEVDLAMDDQDIADNLGITTGNLHMTRMRAREAINYLRGNS